MRLIRLELQDIATFGKFDESFDGNLVGIVGPNGSGKSTIVSAVQFCATGDLTRLGSRDAVSVKRTYPGSQPFVRLTFQPLRSSDEPACVTRWLPDGKKDGQRKLIYDGQSWTIADEIVRQMTKWTGLSPRLLSEFVFVEQGKTADVVTAPAAKRAEILHKLFGVDAADTARETAADHLAGLPGVPDTEVLTALRARVAEASAALAEAGAALSALPHPPNKDAVNSARALLGRYATQARLTSEWARLDEQVIELDRRLALPPVESPDQVSLFAAEDQVRKWEAHLEKADAALQLQNMADAQVRTATSLAAAVPPHPGNPPDPPEELTTLRLRQYAYEVITAAHTHDGSTCPVCQHPLDPDLADKTKAKSALARLKTLDSEYAATVSKHQRLVTVYERNQAASDLARTAVLRLRAEATAAARLVTVCPPGSYEGAKAQAERLRGQAREAVEDANNRISVADRRRTLMKSRQALESEIGDIISDEAAKIASELIETATADMSNRREAEARFKALRESYNSAVGLVEKAEAQLTNASLTQGWRTVVEEVRTILHRDAAPAQAALSCLEDLTSDLNIRLGHLGARYRVRVRDDGKLLADYKDGTSTKTVRADLLSGGEESVLGLAWRIALLDRYAPDAGLLCLDEPTHGLDRERVTALRSALEAWRPHGSDRQVLVVTHDRTLLSVFDRVIDLR